MRDHPRKLAFMARAIALSVQNVTSHTGGPFGTVVVKDDEIIAEGTNLVTATNDPTAHAEIVALRAACATLKSFQLIDCDVYTSCEPCPMCLAALYWARPRRIFYAGTHEDAASVGFDDAYIYGEIGLPIAQRAIPMERFMRKEAQQAFVAWFAATDKEPY